MRREVRGRWRATSGRSRNCNVQLPGLVWGSLGSVVVMGALASLPCCLYSQYWDSVDSYRSADLIQFWLAALDPLHHNIFLATILLCRSLLSYIRHQLHIEQILRLNSLCPGFLYILSTAHLFLTARSWLTVWLEDQVFFKDGLGLHGGYSGEDVEDLVVARCGHLAEEEEFVHFLKMGCRFRECLKIPCRMSTGKQWQFLVVWLAGSSCCMWGTSTSSLMNQATEFVRRPFHD